MNTISWVSTSLFCWCQHDYWSLAFNNDSKGICCYKLIPNISYRWSWSCTNFSTRFTSYDWTKVITCLSTLFTQRMDWHLCKSSKNSGYLWVIHIFSRIRVERLWCKVIYLSKWKWSYERNFVQDQYTFVCQVYYICIELVYILIKSGKFNATALRIPGYITIVITGNVKRF